MMRQVVEIDLTIITQFFLVDVFETFIADIHIEKRSFSMGM